MNRIGIGWCVLVTIAALILLVLGLRPLEPGSEMLATRLLDTVEPRGLAIGLGVSVVALLLFLTVAIVRSAWNRIAPHVLEGARAMTFAEAYGVTIVLGFVL